MPEYTSIEKKPGVRVIRWGPFTTADRAGNWAFFPDMPGKNIRTYGTFGAAAAIVMKAPGNNNTRYAADTDTTLNDSRGEGNPAIIGDQNCIELNENPDRFAPYLTGGDGDTSVYVVATCIG